VGGERSYGGRAGNGYDLRREEIARYMETVLRIGCLLVGAFASWGLWLAEVCFVKGWAGLAWLSGFNWSSLPICALIVVTSSYVVSTKAARRQRIKFAALGFIITTGAFWVFRRAALALFSSAPFSPTAVAAIAALILVPIAVAVSLSTLASRWLAPLGRWTAILVAVALILVLPLSFATVKLFPALNGSRDQIHAIKMGYPVFWAALLVPIALGLGRKRPGTVPIA
jgi:hypothetical protein